MNSRLKLIFGSLSLRLTLVSTFMTFLLILLFWFVLYDNLEKQLTAQQEEIISDRMRTIRSLLSTEGEAPEKLKSRIESEWANRKFERIYVRIHDEKNQLVSETPNLSADEMDIFSGPNDTATHLENAHASYKISRAQFSILAKQNHNYSVVMALDRTSEDKLLKKFRQSLVFVFAFGLVVCFLLAQILARTSVHAIQKMSARITEVNSSTLKERVLLDHVPVEFHELGRNVNEMLDRIEKSFLQLSQFSDDMAHEIRTPINNILGVLGVAISQIRTPADYENAIISSLEEGERLKRIVDSLMFIARTKDPKLKIEMTRVDLGKTLLEIIEFYQGLSDTQILFEAEPSIFIRADRTLLQRAVGNLISNAIRYGREGKNVRIAVVRNSNRVKVSVQDQGVGIPLESLKNVGDRFFRVDDSRAKALGGTGLGLSIVKSIAFMHDGEMQIESVLGQGTNVTIDFEAC